MKRRSIKFYYVRDSDAIMNNYWRIVYKFDDVQIFVPGFFTCKQNFVFC